MALIDIFSFDYLARSRSLRPRWVERLNSTESWFNDFLLEPIGSPDAVRAFVNDLAAVFRPSSYVKPYMIGPISFELASAEFWDNKRDPCQTFEYVGSSGCRNVRLCGTDPVTDERKAHTNFNIQVGNLSGVAGPYFNNWEISYFLGIDASDNYPQMCIAGDRNIYGQAPGVTSLPPLISNNGYGWGPGIVVAMGTNFDPGVLTPTWTDKMHQKNGNVLLADGSVQELSSSKLRDQFRNSGDTSTLGPGPAGNCLAFP